MEEQNDRVETAVKAAVEQLVKEKYNIEIEKCSLQEEVQNMKMRIETNTVTNQENENDNSRKENRGTCYRKFCYEVAIMDKLI